MIIFGVDPGTATTGYGVLEKQGQKLKVLTYGAIITPKEDPNDKRLLTIYNALTALLDEYEPDAFAIEKLFFGNNVTTALVVGRTVGVALLAAAQREIPCMEYRPVEVKLAVAGYGAAEKRQVQLMVQRLLGLQSLPKPDDAADALAIAICHAHSSWATVSRAR